MRTIRVAVDSIPMGWVSNTSYSTMGKRMTGLSEFDVEDHCRKYAKKDFAIKYGIYWLSQMLTQCVLLIIEVFLCPSPYSTLITTWIGVCYCIKTSLFQAYGHARLWASHRHQMTGTRWRRDMETLSSLLAICEDNLSRGLGDSSHKGPAMRICGVFFVVSLDGLYGLLSRVASDLR